MILRAALLALAALAAPGLASAQERELGAMLSVARACLAQVTAQRGSDAFVQGDMAALVRKLASDIDYAEAWTRKDGAMAVRYLSPAMDCDNTVATWVADHAPKGTPLRRIETARGDITWSPDERSAPDLSFLVTGRARRGISYQQYMGPSLVAWETPYQR